MAWDVIFYATAEGSVPGADFLDGCPAKVRGTILAVLDAVAAAPPPAFSGGGKWEAMHGDMGGYYEIRVTGPGRERCEFRREPPIACVLWLQHPRSLRLLSPARRFKLKSKARINSERRRPPCSPRRR
jgi:hypothetical protein